MSVRLSLAGFAVLSSTVTFLAACSTGIPAEPGPTVTATETSTITVTPKPTDSPKIAPSSPSATPKASAAPFSFRKDVSGLLVHNKDGSEYLVQIKLGPIMTNATTGMKAGKIKLGSACAYNPRTDAVVQYVMQVSSHTPSDMAVWNLEIRTTNAASAFPVVAEQFATNTGNLNCVGDDQPIYQYGGSFSPDGSRTIYGNIIIPGYKTAAHPKNKLAKSPLRFKVTGTVLVHKDFGPKTNGYYPLPLG